jgi:hypothetical protein
MAGRRGDEVLVSDGPFAETREQIGGFDLIDCKDLDEAIEIASKHPIARYGTIEIRPIWSMSTRPTYGRRSPRRSGTSGVGWRPL